MNTNLIHNILNILIALVSALTAFLVATGCTSLPTGALDCSQSWIGPEWTALAATVLALVKSVINIARDGLTGLAKRQPPVQ
jgi:hypothetical protein